MSPVTRPSPKTIRLVAYAVIIVIAIWVCIRLLSHATSETTNDAYVVADFTLVAPRIAGQISEVLVEDNQQVKAGQLLVRIDDRDFKAALMSAEADVTAEKASVANYEAEIARQPSLVDQARATLKSDEASIAFARQNASRYQNLSESGAGTAQEQQQSSSTLAQLLAQQAHDRAALSTTEQNLAVLNTERNKAAGALGRAEAVLEQARLNLSYTQIPAPVDGKVGRRSVRVGAFVTTGTPLLAIVPLDSHLEIEAMVSNRDIGFVHADQEAEIKIDTFSFTRYGLLHGKVLNLSQDAIARDKPQDKSNDKAPGAENSTSEPKGQELNYAARVSIDSTQMQVEDKLVNLSPGMAVTVEIKTGTRRIISYLLSPLLRYKQEVLRER